MGYPLANEELYAYDILDSDDSCLDDILIPLTDNKLKFGTSVPYTCNEFSKLKQTLSLDCDNLGIDHLGKKVCELTTFYRSFSFITSEFKYRFAYAFEHGFAMPETFTELKGLDIEGNIWKISEQKIEGRYSIITNHLEDGNIKYNINLDPCIKIVRLDIHGQSYIIDPINLT